MSELLVVGHERNKKEVFRAALEFVAAKVLSVNSISVSPANYSRSTRPDRVFDSGYFTFITISPD